MSFTMHEFSTLIARHAHLRSRFRISAATTWRRRVRRLVAAVLLAVGAFGALTNLSVTPAMAAPATAVRFQEADDLANFVDVIDVNGYIDRVMRDFITDSIESAVANKSQALIIQLNSPGSLLSDDELAKLEAKIRDDHRIPITVWVGGYKARAKGGAARLVAAADLVGVADNTKIGNAPLCGRRHRPARRARVQLEGSPEGEDRHDRCTGSRAVRRSTRRQDG